jgi:hypothetical protein
MNWPNRSATAEKERHILVILSGVLCREGPMYFAYPAQTAQVFRFAQDDNTPEPLRDSLIPFAQVTMLAGSSS